MEPVTAPTDRRDVRQVAVSPYVRILVHNGQNVVSTVALLDPGCETSLISKELALVLDLTGKQTKIKLGTAVTLYSPSLNPDATFRPLPTE